MISGFLLLVLLITSAARCQSSLQGDPAAVYESRKEDFVPTYGGGGGGMPARGGDDNNGGGGGGGGGGDGGTVPFTGVPLPPFNGGGGSGGGGGGSGGGGGGSGGGGGGTPGTIPFIGGSPPSTGTTPSNPAPSGGGTPGTIPFIGGSPPSTGTTPSNPAPSGGCTCYFWADNPQLWPPFLTIFSSIANIFQGIAPRIFGNGMTLLTALRNKNSDPFSRLLREGTAALLNSYVHKNFPSTPQYVKVRFNSALVSKKAAALQAAKFARMNGAYGGKLDYCFF